MICIHELEETTCGYCSKGRHLHGRLRGRRYDVPEYPGWSWAAGESIVVPVMYESRSQRLPVCLDESDQGGNGWRMGPDREFGPRRRRSFGGDWLRRLPEELTVDVVEVVQARRFQRDYFLGVYHGWVTAIVGWEPVADFGHVAWSEEAGDFEGVDDTGEVEVEG